MKKLRFLELPGWKKVPIDDLGGRNLLPILDFKNIATKEVPHFSGLSLTFLFMKWISSSNFLLIYFLTKKWPHISNFVLIYPSWMYPWIYSWFWYIHAKKDISFIGYIHEFWIYPWLYPKFGYIHCRYIHRYIRHLDIYMDISKKLAIKVILPPFRVYLIWEFLNVNLTT